MNCQRKEKERKREREREREGKKLGGSKIRKCKTDWDVSMGLIRR